MKKITKTLKEKYTESVNKESKKAAKFLKRRRIELGMTLETVSEGICSTSYLSKIENCQVEVDRSYFQLLFEKLKIKYDDMLEIRKFPIYQEFVKAYLMKDYKFIYEKVNEITENINYCETEVEILVVLYNIIEGHYGEAFDGIHRLEIIRTTLTDEELEVLNFLTLLYHYKISDYHIVRESLDELYRLNLTNEIIKAAINDVILDYYFDINDYGNFNYLYNQIRNTDCFKLIVRLSLKHQLQELVVRCNNPFELVNSQFDLIRENLNVENEDLFDYYYSLMLIKKKEYLEAYKYLINKKLNQELLALCGIAINHLNDINLSVEFLNILRDFNFVKFGAYYEFLEYLRLKLEQFGYLHLYGYLKNILFNEHNILNNKTFFNEEMNDFLDIAFELGKYKETLKLLKTLK